MVIVYSINKLIKGESINIRNMSTSEFESTNAMIIKVDVNNFKCGNISCSKYCNNACI